MSYSTTTVSFMLPCPAAEVVTDGVKRSRHLRGNRYFLRLSRHEIGVDLQWPEKEAVRDVLARDDELDGLPFLQRDRRGNKFEPPGGDRDRAGLCVAVGRHGCHDQGGKQEEGE
jgi:hypothetical protein